MGMIVAIFGVGANISIYRDENKNAADNGIFYGIILSMLIFSVIIFNSNKYINLMNMNNTIYKTFKIIEKNNIKNYKEFLDFFIKNEKIKELINSIINIFILVSFYIMIAGFGAYLEQEINLNNFIGSSILAILCVILFRTNINGIVKINEILIPILIAVVLVIRNSKFKKY